MHKRILLALSFGALAACGGGDDSGAVTAAVAEAPATPASGVEAMVRTQDYVRGAGDQRKVHAAESSEDQGSEGNYVVGRVEHPSFGAFPIIDARAESIEGVGTVITFSDRPIGEATWEQLVQKQRAARAVAGVTFGDGYMLSSLEFAGPGMEVVTVPAEQISNASLDETSIAGLIKQSAPGQPSIVANFRLPLKAAATTP